MPPPVSNESLAPEKTGVPPVIKRAPRRPSPPAAEIVSGRVADHIEPDASDSTSASDTGFVTEAFPEASVAEVPAAEYDQATIQMDPPLQAIGAAWLNDQGEDFSMPLPNGRELEIQVERFVAIGEAGGEFIGTVRATQAVVWNFPIAAVERRGRFATIGKSNVYYAATAGRCGCFSRAKKQSRWPLPPMPLSEIPPPPSFIPSPPPVDFGLQN